MQGKTPTTARGSYTATGDQTALVANKANQTFYLTDVIVSAAANQIVLVKIGSTSVLTVRCLANSTVPVALATPLCGSQNEAVLVNLNANDQTEVTLIGYYDNP